MKKQMTAAEMGRKGGRARAASLPASEQRASGLRAVEARWGRTGPHVTAVLEGFDACALVRHIDARLGDVPVELRDEVRRRALRAAIRRQTEAVAASIGPPRPVG